MNQTPASEMEGESVTTLPLWPLIDISKLLPNFKDLKLKPGKQMYEADTSHIKIFY